MILVQLKCTRKTSIFLFVFIYLQGAFNFKWNDTILLLTDSQFDSQIHTQRGNKINFSANYLLRNILQKLRLYHDSSSEEVDGFTLPEKQSTQRWLITIRPAPIPKWQLLNKWKEMCGSFQQTLEGDPEERVTNPQESLRWRLGSGLRGCRKKSPVLGIFPINMYSPLLWSYLRVVLTNLLFFFLQFPPEIKIMNDFDMMVQSINKWMTESEDLVNSLQNRLNSGEFKKRIQQITVSYWKHFVSNRC